WSWMARYDVTPVAPSMTRYPPKWSLTPAMCSASGSRRSRWQDWRVERDHDDSEWWLNVAPQTIQAALTLAQTTWWVDSESVPHLVDAMSVQHRFAVIDYLMLRSRDLLISVQETHIRARP